MKSLFDQVEIGALKLKNRIVMAPLTRSRASEGRVPNDLMRDYYVQRVTAGLIVTEATAITAKAVGYADTPGIWSDEQIVGWKKIVDAVHEAGGKIVMQLWHVGRISHSYFLNGELPVAPSAIVAPGHVSLLTPQRPYETPRALELSEIKQIIQDYKQAAKNAKAAGFDGVEIHGANGYLPEQFLASKTNLRTDEYGGSVENRARFLLEATDVAVEVWGADRVGVHLSPNANSEKSMDANPKETYGYVARELNKRKVAFIFIRESKSENYLTPYLKQEFAGPVIANDGIDPKTATDFLNTENVDLISFGKMYISNPDLVLRIREKAPLNELNYATIYAAGSIGYVDYPMLVR